MSEQVVSKFFLGIVCAAALFAPLPSLADGHSVKVLKDEYLLAYPQSKSAFDQYPQSLAAFSLPLVTVQKTARFEHVRIDRPADGDALAGAAVEGNIVDYNSADDLCPQLIQQHPGATCSPNFVEKLLATPNDQFFAAEQWALHNTAPGGVDIDAPQAWDKSTGSGNVLVALIDSGVELDHPDLLSNLWVNSGEVPNNFKDDDNNGYVDDFRGFNTITSTGNVADDNGHGTNIAGIIGARGNNAIGVAGVNWKVGIIPVKSFNEEGTSSSATTLAAINYVIALKESGANISVINYSASGGGYSQPVYDAIKRAGELGILFVTAAGNDGTDNDASPQYPGSYDLPNIIAVAAVDRNGNAAPESNFGLNTVDLFAPGVSIASTGINKGYLRLSFGTSYSTGFVSGAVALLNSVSPGISAADARALILNTAVLRASLTGLAAVPGILNLEKLLNESVLTTPTPTPTPTTPPNTGPTNPTAKPTVAPTPGAPPQAALYNLKSVKKKAKSATNKKAKKPLIQISRPTDTGAIQAEGVLNLFISLGEEKCAVAQFPEAGFQVNEQQNFTIKVPKFEGKALKPLFILSRDDGTPASNSLKIKLPGKSPAPAKSSAKKRSKSTPFQTLCKKMKAKPAK